MSPHAKEWLIRIALVCGAPLLFLGGAEMLLRAAGVGYDPAFWVPVPGGVAPNDDFGLRFFPRGLARTPAPDIVAMPKPAGARRVFLLGESAAMGFPEPAIGLAPMLELLLRESQPSAGWEVHNAAMTAINSHVIVPIARDSARLSPDVFIVLAGNNEAVGPYGPATVFGQSGLPLPLVRASNFVAATRLGQAMRRVMRGEAAREWRGMEMFLERRISASDPRLERMYGAFGRNLRDVAGVGAKVIFVTVPVNLRDCPPFAGDDSDYRRGLALQRAGDNAQALTLLRRARDRDELRFRADSRINEAVRQAARATGAELVDAEQEFGLAGNDLFWEHVHFTPAGTYRMARMLANALDVETAMPYEDVREKLPVTAWDERNAAAQIAALMRRPPFSARMTPPEVPGDAGQARTQATRLFEAAVAKRPRDVNLLGRYTSLLRESGEAKRAADVLATMMRIVPGRKAWHVSRGAALTDAGLLEEAAAEHRAALRIDADYDLAHFGLGVVAARGGHHAEAVGHYEAALRISPSYADAAYNLAGSLAALGRTADARARLERAAAAQPGSSRLHLALAQLDAREGHIAAAIHHYTESTRGDAPAPEAHYDLGVLLARQGRLADAVAHYRRAVDMRPDYAEAYNNLGIALARQGDRAAAADAFARAVKVRPGFEAARANLQKLGSR